MAITETFQEHSELDPRLLNKSWRLRNLYWIKDRNGVIVKFIPNEAQDLFFRNRHTREIILKARQLGFCLHPNTRILMRDLSWKTLRDVEPGEEIVSVDEMPDTPHAERKKKNGFIEKKWSVFKEAFKITFSDGREIIATGQHRFLFKARGAAHTQWRTISEAKVGDEIRSICQVPSGDPSFEDSWAKITSITSLGEMEMIDLQTSDKTFIAEGLVSHNSTAVAIDILDDALFTKFLAAAITADKLENAKNIFDKIDFAWQMFPKELKEFLKLDSESDSSTMISFTNGSFIRVGTSLHSGTYQRVHVSEYGPLCAQFPDKAEDLKKSVFPTVSENGRITIESTAEGEGNDFHDLCVEAEARATKAKDLPLHPLEFKFHFFPWYLNTEYQTAPSSVDIPDRLIRYFDDLEKKKGIILTPAQRAWYALTFQSQKARMKEQYPSTPEEAFLSSGDRLFDADIIKSKLETDVLPPAQILLEGRLLIYKPFVPRHRYGVSGDPSQGIGRDSATAQVIDFTTNEQVATFEDPNISPTEFGDILAYIGNLYGQALLAPESNNHGHATVARLVQLEYPNLYRFVVKGTLDEHETERIGWLTTQITKPRMFFELSEALSDPHSPLIVRDEATLKEAQYYQKGETNIISPLSRKKLSRHYDRLTALAICFQLRNEAQAAGALNPRQIKRIQERRQRNKSMH